MFFDILAISRVILVLNNKHPPLISATPLVLPSHATRFHGRKPSEPHSLGWSRYTIRDATLPSATPLCPLATTVYRRISSGRLLRYYPFKVGVSRNPASLAYPTVPAHIRRSEVCAHQALGTPALPASLSFLASSFIFLASSFTFFASSALLSAWCSAPSQSTRLHFAGS